MEEETIEIPSAAPNPTDAVSSSNTESKNRKRKAFPKSGILRIVGSSKSRNFKGRLVIDYMLNQPQLTVLKRGDLVGWILTQCQWDRRDPILTFAAVDIFDRFLSVQVVSPEEVRYLCVAALHLAIKYYETQGYKTPSLDDLTKSINKGLPDPDCLHRYRARIMELRILNEFGWEIDVPTVYSFLILFIDAAKIPPDSPAIKMAYFYAKLGVWDYCLMMAFPQEMLAAAAFVAACAYTNSISMCRPISQVYTGLKRKQLLECSKRLRKLHRAGHGYKLGECIWWISFEFHTGHGQDSTKPLEGDGNTEGCMDGGGAPKSGG